MTSKPETRPTGDIRAITLEGEPVTYRVKRTSRKWSIGLQVDERGLLVTVPKRGASARSVEQVLRDKAGWVLKTLGEWRERAAPRLAWHEGARLPYLGAELVLAFNRANVRGRVLRLDGHVLATLPDPEDTTAVEKLMTRWYREEALALFRERVAHYARRLELAPPRIRLSTARTRWGSCNENGTITLNLRLVQLPLKLVDYVVAHELAHLKEMNHSARFWALVESLIPDYREAREKLKNLS
ncbi:MAG: M48 family metallopeptidase [Betaproteobacteria bacterium]|nr:M48 family metallopeptidase [Betaproteobacteria bacterium]